MLSLLRESRIICLEITYENRCEIEIKMNKIVEVSRIDIVIDKIKGSQFETHLKIAMI